jgi:hypothetical protein
MGLSNTQSPRHDVKLPNKGALIKMRMYKIEKVTTETYYVPALSQDAAEHFVYSGQTPGPIKTDTKVDLVEKSWEVEPFDDGINKGWISKKKEPTIETIIL